MRGCWYRNFPVDQEPRLPFYFSSSSSFSFSHPFVPLVILVLVSVLSAMRLFEIGSCSNREGKCRCMSSFGGLIGILSSC